MVARPSPNAPQTAMYEKGLSMRRNERRDGARVDWDGVAIAQTGGRLIKCRGIDRSTRGLAIASSWYAYPGRTIDIRFMLYGKMVHMRGIVAWSSRADLQYV